MGCSSSISFTREFTTLWRRRSYAKPGFPYHQQQGRTAPGTNGFFIEEEFEGWSRPAAEAKSCAQ
ncbi:hypothetical protein KCP76_03440 [Salmonella enterica subsp. enterica serovar Weltevreden]|nr:hypothetical protein KCP76_03440 [Salmonella enterica subsp. enterica serovar Weltevreden]